MEKELQIQREPDGVVVKVRVAPRSSRTVVDGVYRGALKIHLTSPPVDNAANRELVAFLSKELKIPKSAVRIVGGGKSRNKKLALIGVDESDILELIS